MRAPRVRGQLFAGAAVDINAQRGGEDTPPDPGNSGPEQWTAPLDRADVDEVRALLDAEFGEGVSDGGGSGSGDRGRDGGLDGPGRR